VTFDLLSCQFVLAARRVVQFPPGMAGNVLRGALGSALREASAEDYVRMFVPAATVGGPSGLSDRPRPFVIRCAALNGRILQPADRFCFGLHLFDVRNPTLEHFTQAFAKWAHLISVEHTSVTVDLNATRAPVSRIRVEFQTPTELKSAAGDAKDFHVLLARARDRVSTLRSLYGAGPLEIDFRGLAERARSVKTVRSELRHVEVERRSRRSGQRHGIGGLVGFADYEGDLAEFLPFLKAASFTGVGRHCTWGNGQIHTEILDSDS
jgi:CRISPR-associated endoribonuclease Cas6